MAIEPTRHLRCCWALIGFWALGFASLAAQPANMVELKALDGSATVIGELLAIEEGAYVVKTRLGVLNIMANRVSCKGDACVAPASETGIRTVSTDQEPEPESESESEQSNAPFVMAQFKPLIDAYSASIGASVEPRSDHDQIQSIQIETPQGSFDLEIDVSRNANGQAHEADPAALRIKAFPITSELASDQNWTLLGFTAAGLAVHPDNPAQTLEFDSISAMLKCESRIWPDGREIDLVTIDDAGMTTATMTSTVWNEDDGSHCQDPEAISNEATLLGRLLGNPATLAIVNATQRRVVNLLPVNRCGLARAPDAVTIKNGEYPFARGIYLSNVPGSANAAADAFAAFVRSDAGQAALSKGGLIDKSISLSVGDGSDHYELRKKSAYELSQQDGVSKAFARATLGARRLSVTFRFQASSGSLNERAQIDLERLKAFLDQEAEGNRELLVFGFADSSGGYENNLALSKRRADTVAAELERRGIQSALVAAFGEEAPTQCNDTAENRAQNRRVEIWLR